MKDGKTWQVLLYTSFAEFLAGFIILTFVIKESPHWLYGKGRYEECANILKSSASEGQDL